MTITGTLPQLILLFVTDQFRYDAFDPFITPHLYELSLHDDAMTFSNAYTSTPTCTPARSSLLTGKSPWYHGMLGYASSGVNCQKYQTTLPQSLREFAHYETYTVGKNHYGYDNNTGSYVNHSFQHLMIYDGLAGFHYNHSNVTVDDDDYTKYYHHIHPNVHDPLDITCHHLGYNDWKSCPYGSSHEDEHPTMWTTREAIRYLQHFPFHEGKRMFLKVSYHRPHSPYDPPQRLLKKMWRYRHNMTKRYVNHTSWDKKYLNTTVMESNAFMGDPGDDTAFHSRVGYYASVHFVDEGIGHILQYLQSIQQYDNAFIMWVSDHGDQNGDHFLWRKGYPYESNCHLRFIMKLPATNHNSTIKTSRHIKKKKMSFRRRHLTKHENTNNIPASVIIPPRTSLALVELRDVAVTIYDYVGMLSHVQQLDPYVNGQSLLPLYYGTSHHVRNWLDLEHSRIYRADIHWNAIVGFSPDRDDDHPIAQHDNISQRRQHSSGDNDDDDTTWLLWKYIFHVYDGSEQLFCLSRDPNESYDIAMIQPIMLQYWRRHMIQQFQEEGRGEMWVKDDQLVKRRQPMIYGPHYPCH